MWKSIPNRGLVLVVCATTWCVANTLRAQTILYVDSQAPDGGDGDRWASAFNKLQDALDQQSVDQIWVAQGTYKPTYEAVPGEPRSKTFQLLDGVAIYGGFAGVETGIDQRDVGRYLTVLSGDLDGDDHDGGDTSENCYHVVTADQTFVLDGLTIVAGRADGSDSHRPGGGMLVHQASPASIVPF